MHANRLNALKELTVFMEPYWGRLSPIHQSTSAADTLLGNAFEPLVDLDPQGGIAPGVAVRWEVSGDDRLLRFYLRPEARFSDGTLLTPKIYRDALLGSMVSDDRDSHNPNTLDVLYRLKGFDLRKARAGQIDGLYVDKDGALVFEFDAPFRTALAELTGTRYAAWIRDARTGEFLGTGPYRIAGHLENKKVIYEPNKFAWRPAAFDRVTVLATDRELADLCENKGDVYAGRPFRTSESDRACQYARIGFQGGAISGHALVAVNAVPGKLFSKIEFRQALQYAIHEVITPVIEEVTDPRRYTTDPQFFPPLWPGRLDHDEASRIVGRGKEHLASLILATRSRPIEFLGASPIVEKLQIGLEKMGLRFTRPPRQVPIKTVLEAMYGKRDYDLNSHSAMVVGSDPDGLYHLLGKHGALASPAICRGRVQDGMEKARDARSSENLHDLYIDVSRAALQEVPEVHLAFIRNGAHFNIDRVQPIDRGQNSERFQFNNFVRK